MRRSLATPWRKHRLAVGVGCAHPAPAPGGPPPDWPPRSAARPRHCAGPRRLPPPPACARIEAQAPAPAPPDRPSPDPAPLSGCCRSSSSAPASCGHLRQPPPLLTSDHAQRLPQSVAQKVIGVFHSSCTPQGAGIQRRPQLARTEHVVLRRHLDRTLDQAAIRTITSCPSFVIRLWSNLPRTIHTAVRQPIAHRRTPAGSAGRRV